MRLLALTLATLFAPLAAAQPGLDSPPAPDDRPDFDERFTVMAGLNQLALGGVNVAASYHRGRLVAEYSHGASLNFNALNNALLTQADQDLGLDLDVPWTTGFGVGYRITRHLDLRAEFKAHRHEASVDGAEDEAYTTFTIGPGLYYTVPIWKGLRIEPSVRYWPTVATTLDNGEVRFERADGEILVHEAYDIGPIVNVSVGYSF